MRIAILSRGSANYTTKRLKEEALKRGHEVRVIRHSKCYMAIEKGNPVVYYKGEELDSFDAIIPRIAQSYTKYGCAVVNGAFRDARRLYHREVDCYSTSE